MQLSGSFFNGQNNILMTFGSISLEIRKNQTNIAPMIHVWLKVNVVPRRSQCLTTPHSVISPHLELSSLPSSFLDLAFLLPGDSSLLSTCALFIFRLPSTQDPASSPSPSPSWVERLPISPPLQLRRYPGLLSAPSVSVSPRSTRIDCVSLPPQANTKAKTLSPNILKR